MNEPSEPKNIIGYCEPWSLRAGENVRLMASSHAPGTAALDLVRIRCGDPGRKGPGFIEEVIARALPRSVSLERQILTPGSYAAIDLRGITVQRGMTIKVHVMPTRPEQDQDLLCLTDARGALVSLAVRAGQLVIECGGIATVVRARALSAGRWYVFDVALEFGPNGTLASTLTPLATRSPGTDFDEPAVSAQQHAPLSVAGGIDLEQLYLGRGHAGQYFDGRLARVQLHIDDATLAWDLAQDIGGKTVVDVSGNGRDGVLYQLPSRAVTGPDWDGTAQSWHDCPAHYDAVHFHSDDLYDADWPVTCELALPRDLPSGIYAFRLRDEVSEDRSVFFVRPALGATCADVALLMPSCTYMAYANHRMLLEGADFVAARNALRPEHEYLRGHREVGLSCYEKHADGSGVMFSSRRRPVMQMRPGADRWNFTPDTCLNAFLEHLDIGHDIIADEDVHADGFAALSPYRLIVTGTHPEYWSTAMLDALEQWQREGGRLMYLGGNGFYWRVAFSDAWPGAIELRRAEDGVRNWQSEPGESYHAFNGEYGGLWRRLGRAPNQLVGIGFAAQGFERAIGYQRNAASHDPRAAWIFEGVPDGAIGTSGLGGGAAGQEIDRYDTALGSPPHALVVASATDFGADMLRTKEEFEAAMVPTTDDEMVRADIVFYETPAGGAVFSVGSISWFGALARDDYANDIARITENVVRRFADARPFGEQAAATDGAGSTGETF